MGHKYELFEKPSTYPKKMKAFWKKIAIPGYTTGFSERDVERDMQIVMYCTFSFCKISNPMIQH